MPATPPPDRLRDRVALVTAGAHGIGRANALRLGAEGAVVVVADVDDDAAAATAADIVATGGRAAATHCDVTDTASVEATVSALVGEHGRLDVLVCGVGVCTPEDLDELDDAAWDGQVDPTLHGAVRCVRAAMPHLLASPVPTGGAVVMISSVNAIAAFGNVAYSAAKAGLASVAQNLAVRYGAQGLAMKGPSGARPVRVNVVAPGTIRTRVWDERPVDRLAALYPMGRVGEPEDIAAAMAFLVSDDAEWITGIVLPVEGGVLAGPWSRFAGDAQL